MKNLDLSCPFLISRNYARARLDFSLRPISLSSLSGNESFRCLLKTVVSAIANTDYTTQEAPTTTFTETP